VDTNSHTDHCGRSFELLIQSSTFLPLALALVALTSRMDMLAVEMKESIETVWPVMLAVADILGVSIGCLILGNNS
jgi:hypothetical protein